jgi:60 kDa SS-A/Ro ribonucleoprotein
MRLNTSVKFTEKTHEGAPAARMTPEQALRRSVLSCMLFEDEFYIDGKTIAERILELSAQVKPEVLAALAVEARSTFNLRHVPLLLLKALVKHGTGRMVADAIFNTIQRADELAEFLAIYWQDGKKPLSNPMRKGLARAFLKFNEYQLVKYNRPGAVKLHDVLFLCHAKPDTDERAATWKKLIDGTLPAPDTWESNLVAGKDKKETFERLIREGNLGYFALLRNLRGMAEAGVDLTLVREAILARKGGAEKILPFRFVAAARACPQLEPELDMSLVANIAALPPLDGNTIVLVDVSGSMEDKLSAKSDMTRMDAAATLASVINGQCRVFTFSQALVEVPPRKGMSGVDAIVRSQDHAGTYLGQALDVIYKFPHDRLIVITDEQSHDRVANPIVAKSYMINVASNKNGVGYGPWKHIDGFSEGVICFIHEIEAYDGR